MRYVRRVADFPVVDVSAWEVVREEPGGETAKDWLKDPASDLIWLSKAVTLKRLDDGRQYRRGQDWAEKAASEIAGLLGLPAANVELATRDAAPGLISQDLKTGGFSLGEAADFLSELDPSYVPWTPENKIKNRVGHNLENIRALLDGVEAPPQTAGDASGMSASEVFTGYLLFDTLVANVDRHDRNWAILREASGQRYLSATYDHGSAFGSGLDEHRREAVLPTVDQWCLRGFAQRFEDGHDTSLLELAIMFGSGVPEALDYWRSRILALGHEEIAVILARISVMSEAERTFVVEVVLENQRRIRDDDH